MPPPGRRRTAGCQSRPFLLALIFLFLISTASAASSVLGIDFGTLHLKAALVKPGIPLEIVLTKDSKRKETAAVAFKLDRDVAPQPDSFPERLYGGDALALQGRMPGEVFPNLKPLLGLMEEQSEEEHDALREYRWRNPAVQVERISESGTTVVKSSAFAEDEMPWGVEELLAMELANIRRNAEAMAGKGNVVEDVVITVPAFYTAEERRAIKRAATLAGLDVNALISDGLAVGVDYAKSRTFPEISKGQKPEYHIVFDMGAGSTTATLLRFQSRSVKDVGRFNKTIQEVAVVGSGWDRTLGGDSFTSLVVNDYVLKFLTKPVTKSRGMSSTDLTSNGRVMSRLWSEAEKARQVLSANSETSSSFEELLPDIDFKVKLTRSQYEELVSDFAERVSQPISDALAAARLEISDISSIILHGGAVRTPFVQRKLEEIAGGTSKLRSNVNADESAVFGAAFKAAGLSPSFKVKEIRDSDVAGYSAGMMYKDGGKDRRQILFGSLSPVGSGASTKQVAFKDKDDFTFGLYQVVNDNERSIWHVETSNLTAGVKQLKSKFGCEQDDVSTKFSIRLSAVDGLPEVVGGSISCEVEGDGKGESLGDSVKDWLGFGKKKDQEALMDGEDEDSGPTEAVEATTSTVSDTGESVTSSASASSSKAAEKPKRRTESISIAFTMVPQGNPQPTPEEMSRMRDRLAAFDRSDHARVAREEALNVLEGYTYQVRDFLDNADYQSVSTAAQRDSISKLLASTREFMENARDATRDTLTEKLNALKELVEPVQARRREDIARPEKVTALRSSLGQTEKFIEMVKEQIEQAKDAKRQAEDWDASQSAAAEASSAIEEAEGSAATLAASKDSLDDLDDLEEPDASSPTATTDPVPKYTNAADFSPYTDLDLTELKDAHASVSAWLEEKEAAQSKLKPHEEPALLVKDVERKADELGVKMKDLLYKKMKAPPKSSKSKTSKTSKTKKGKKTSSSTSEEEVPTASVTASPHEEIPTEEEILEMVSEAKEARRKSHVIDEL